MSWVQAMVEKKTFLPQSHIPDKQESGVQHRDLDRRQRNGVVIITRTDLLSSTIISSLSSNDLRETECKKAAKGNDSQRISSI